MGNNACGGGDTPPEEESLTAGEPPLSPDGRPPAAGKASALRRVQDEDEEENVTEEEKAARMKSRKCTDVVCVPLFLSSLALLAYILHYASVHGDMRRIYHGLNFHNELCGVDEAVKDKPLLFWCTKPGDPLSADALKDAAIEAVIKNGNGSVDLAGLYSIMSTTSNLDLAHPICVETCPETASTFHSCFQEETVERFPKDVTGTFSQNVTFHYDFVRDHPTTPVAKRYCMPQDVALLEQLSSTLHSSGEGAMFKIFQVFDAWPVLLAAGLLAFVMGYAYLFLVKKLAGPVIYGTFAICTLASLFAGGYLLFGALSQDIDDAFALHLNVTTNASSIFVPTTGYKEADITISALLLLLGLLIMIAAFCLRQTINVVIGSLGATLECLQDMPLLLLQPLLSVALRVSYVCVAFVGLAWLVSIGDVRNYSVSSYVPAGLTRSFSFQDDEMWYVGGYAFLALWYYEFGAAVEQFVFIYGTQMWYFAPYANGVLGKRKQVAQLKILRGLFVGLTYHLGTLAFGSLLLALFRGLYFVLNIIYKQAKAQGDEKTNKVADVAFGCCFCCLKCWEGLIRYLNKDVYIVVSVESMNFCTAAEKMLEVVATEFAALGVLEGATKLFQVGGLGTITAAGSYLTWLVLRDVEMFNSPASDHFVAYPEYVTAAAGVLCFVVATVFMLVFDVVSDTILFCWALDQKDRKEMGMPGINPDTPESMRRLLDAAGGQESAREPLPK